MTARKLAVALVRAGLVSSAALVGTLGAIGGAAAAPCNSPFTKGDVFASVGFSTVNVYTPTGSLVCTLNDTTGARFTTGSGFDAAGNFYVTNFGAAGGAVSKFDNSGTLLAAGFMLSNNTPESINNQATGFYAGLSLVGGPGGALINTFDTATGALVHSYGVAGGNGTGGTDWVDVYDPATGQVIYDGEGSVIRSAILNPDGSVTQLPDFASTGFSRIFAIRTIGSGTFAGDVLVANSINALLLNSSGNVIQTYTLPGNGGSDFSLNLDPDGTHFWTGDFASQNVWQVNIATGAIDQQWNTGTGPSTLYGLSVFGEIQQGGGGGGTAPEPASLALLGTALAAFCLVRRRRNAA